MKLFWLAILFLPATAWAADVAVDTSVVGPQSSAGTSIAWTHACAPNAVLYVGLEDNNAGSTGVTANGVSMTLVSAVGSGQNLSVYVLSGCSGSQSIVTSQPFGFLSGTSVSLVNAGSQPDAVATNNSGGSISSGAIYSSSVVSLVDRCLTLQFFDENFGQGSVFSAGAGTTMVVTGTTGAQHAPEIAIGSAVVTPAGSSIQKVTSNAAQSVWSIMIAVGPAGGFVANQSVISVQ